MGEVKYSMKARVKILVNGAAATLLTGAVAAGLILSSTGALQTKNNDVLAARELDETQEEMTREQSLRQKQMQNWSALNVISWACCGSMS